MKKLTIPFAALFLALATTVHASPSSELTRFMDEEISTIADALSSVNATPADDQSTEAWLFKRFALRVRGKAGFEIPGIAKLQFVPELEMVWDRGWAEGFGGYKP